MTKFDLGVSHIDFTLYQRTPKSSRKRSLSQSRLDTFLVPNSSSRVCLLSDNVLSESSTTKPRPLTHVTKGSAGTTKKKKKKSKKLSLLSGMTTPTSAKGKQKQKVRKLSKSCSTPSTPMSPVTVNNHTQVYCAVSTPKSPRNKAEALKVLNKAKRFKQMDLKKSVIHASDLRPAELEALKEKKKQESERRAAMLEENKRKRREDRMRLIREQQELRRMEKLKKKEWLKPREDLMCEDSLVGGE